MDKTICPYKATNKKSCSHKRTSPTRKGKRYCGHNRPESCELYKEWLESTKIDNKKW